MTTTRRQIRDLLYEPTKLLLSDGREIDGVLADESDSGCGVRLSEQVDLHTGLEVRVLFLGGLRTARIRHVQENIDGPIVGLEFATGSRIPKPQWCPQTDADDHATRKAAPSNYNDLCIHETGEAQESLQCGDLFVQVGDNGNVKLRQEAAGRLHEICLTPGQRMFVAEIVDRILANEALETSEFLLGLPEHDGIGEPVLRIARDHRMSITQLSLKESKINVIWMNAESITNWLSTNTDQSVGEIGGQ